jgi:hypothetical protein
VRRVVVVVLLAAAACAGAVRPDAAGDAQAAASARPCGLPSQQPMWVDFADGSVPFWQLFARPGVVAAAANFIFPPQLRARGAKTLYWDMNFNRRIGTPAEPVDPTLVVERANRLYEYAAEAMACPNTMIVENELNGAGTVTPWSPTNAQYRANVLSFLRTMARRGARPVLLVNSQPYTGGEAADWWRSVAQVADIVREVYFPAPRMYKQGVILGSRSLRQYFRAGADDFLSIGIPPSKVGLMLGFQTTRGSGGREGIGSQRWYQVTKWQTLAAKQVAKELKLAHVWSWGWGVWSKGEDDPDKPVAACVYLWTRNPHLCNAPAAAGPAFNVSRTDGQLIFPAGARCTVSGAPVFSGAIRGIAAVTRDEQAAFSAAYSRTVAGLYGRLSSKQILSAERALIGLRFGGSRAAYVSALARAGASISTARGVIADELRRAEIQARIRVGNPSASEIRSYYETYAGASARLVQVSPRPTWLGRRRRGFALDSVAPPQIFGVPAGRVVKVRTMVGTYKVKAFGTAIPLGALPLARARPAIVAALVALRREAAYQRWLLGAAERQLSQTICWRDQLPATDSVPLTDYLPFLALDAGSSSDTIARLR